jgi:tRNA nucleotidyltransferase (CCA-adding enzyme)
MVPQSNGDCGSYTQSKRFPDTSFIPTFQEIIRVNQLAEDVYKELFMMYLGAGVEIEIVGSVPKGTWIKGKADLDVYIICEGNKESIGKPMTVAEAFEEAKAIHTDGHEKQGGPLKIWNVPWKNIRGEIDVDMVFGKADTLKTDTIMHTAFYRDGLTLRQKTDVMLLKAFWMSMGFYGPPGITGVAIEELVRKYKTAGAVISRIRHWVNKPFLQDPVLKEPRDLLASVSPERWQQIKKTLFIFRHFRYNNFGQREFIERYHDHWILGFDRKKDGNVDHGVAYGQVLSTRAQLQQLTNKEADLSYDVHVIPERILVAIKATPETFEDNMTWRSINQTLFPNQAEKFLEAHDNAKVWTRHDGNVMYSVQVERKVSEPMLWAREYMLDCMDRKGYTWNLIAMPLDGSAFLERCSTCGTPIKQVSQMAKGVKDMRHSKPEDSDYYRKFPAMANVWIHSDDSKEYDHDPAPSPNPNYNPDIKPIDHKDIAKRIVKEEFPEHAGADDGEV